MPISMFREELEIVEMLKTPQGKLEVYSFLIAKVANGDVLHYGYRTLLEKLHKELTHEVR